MMHWLDLVTRPWPSRDPAPRASRMGPASRFSGIRSATPCHAKASSYPTNDWMVSVGHPLLIRPPRENTMPLSRTKCRQVRRRALFLSQSCPARAQLHPRLRKDTN